MNAVKSWNETNAKPSGCQMRTAYDSFRSRRNTPEDACLIIILPFFPKFELICKKFLKLALLILYQTLEKCSLLFPFFIIVLFNFWSIVWELFSPGLLLLTSGDAAFFTPDFTYKLRLFLLLYFSFSDKLFADGKNRVTVTVTHRAWQCIMLRHGGGTCAAPTWHQVTSRKTGLPG